MYVRKRLRTFPSPCTHCYSRHCLLYHRALLRKAENRLLAEQNNKGKRCVRDGGQALHAVFAPFNCGLFRGVGKKVAWLSAADTVVVQSTEGSYNTKGKWGSPKQLGGWEQAIGVLHESLAILRRRQFR